MTNTHRNTTTGLAGRVAIDFWLTVSLLLFLVIRILDSGLFQKVMNRLHL